MADTCSGHCSNTSDGGVAENPVADVLCDGGFASVFTVPKMDCPSEERMIRMAVDAIDPTVVMAFDTPNRKVTVFHGDNIEGIQVAIENLGLGAKLGHTQSIGNKDFSSVVASARAVDNKEALVLKWLLMVNALMFGVEISVGWIAQSTALIADSLDMFADAAVYGLALYAVGHSARMKLRVYLRRSPDFKIEVLRVGRVV